MSEDNAAANRAQYVEALKEERRGYVARGLADRVKQVDAEIARFEGAPKGRKARSTDKG